MNLDSAVPSDGAKIQFTSPTANPVIGKGLVMVVFCSTLSQKLIELNLVIQLKMPGELKMRAITEEMGIMILKKLEPGLRKYRIAAPVLKNEKQHINRGSGMSKENTPEKSFKLLIEAVGEKAAIAELAQQTRYIIADTLDNIAVPEGYSSIFEYMYQESNAQLAAREPRTAFAEITEEIDQTALAQLREALGAKTFMLILNEVCVKERGKAWRYRCKDWARALPLQTHTKVVALLKSDAPIAPWLKKNLPPELSAPLIKELDEIIGNFSHDLVCRETIAEHVEEMWKRRISEEVQGIVTDETHVQQKPDDVAALAKIYGYWNKILEKQKAR